MKRDETDTKFTFW